MVFSGCFFERKPPEDAVAVVGKNYLMDKNITDKLEAMELDPMDYQLRAQVINQWVDRQILLHEAKRLGLHKDKQVDKRLNDLKEELIVNLLFDEAIHVDAPDDDAIVTYWQNHTGEFTRVTDEVNLVLAYAPSRNKAWGIRNGMDRSATDKELLENYGDIRFDTTSSLSIERLPRRVARAIEPLRSGQASLPFELEGQWMVAKLISRNRAGRPRPLEEMMPSIQSRMMAEEEARKRYAFIAGLRREARRQGTVIVRVPTELADEHIETVQDSLIYEDDLSQE